MFRRFRRTGDPAALAEVFDRTAPGLLRLARLLVGRDAADDVVQATFVAAIDSAARFDPERRVRPWLCGLLANHAKRHRQKARREHEALRTAAPYEERSAASAAELASIAEGLTRIRAAAVDCGEPYATVLRLHLEEGLNAKEIAARLGRSAGTVRTQLVRALERLRQRLGPAASAAVVLSPTPGLAELAGVRCAVLGHPKVAAPQLAASGAAAVMVTGTGAVMAKYWLGAAAVVAAVLLVWSRPWQAAVQTPVRAATAPAEVAAGPVPAAAADPTRRIAAPLPAVTDAAADDGAEAAAEQMVTIAGRVTDTAGRPLADAEMVVTSWILRGAEDPEPIGSLAVSDVDGRFAFDFAASGSRQVTDYALEARRDGYEVAELTSLSPGEGDVEFRLVETRCRLRGQVFDLDGMPAPGIEVTLELWREVERRHGRNQTLTLWSDEDGRFDAGWMPAGRGLAFVSSAIAEESSAVDWVASAPFDLVARPVDHVVLQGVPPASVEVQVEDAAGRPMQDVQLWGVSVAARFADRAPAVVRARTDATGAAVLAPMLPGSGGITVRHGGESLHADVELQPGTRTRRAFRFDAPMCALDVVLVGVDAERCGELTVRAVDPRKLRSIEGLMANRSASPTEDGVARLTGLHADLRYRLVLDSPRGELASRERVDPTVGTLRWELGDLDALPTGGVRGRLWSDAGPLSGAVTLMRYEPMRPVGMKGVGADGRFAFERLAAGSYTVTLNVEGHIGYGQDLEVEAGRVTDLGDLRLEPLTSLEVRIAGLTAAAARSTRALFWGPRHALQVMQPDPEQPGLHRAGGLPAGRMSIAVIVPGRVPVIREVGLAAGANPVDIALPAAGSPVRLDLFLKTGTRLIAHAEWTITDGGDDQVVLRDQATGHLDDPETGRVTRRFALEPGHYRIEAVQSFGDGERATVERDFEVVAAGTERALTVRID